VDCPILLKFGRMVHYKFADPVAWLGPKAENGWRNEQPHVGNSSLIATFLVLVVMLCGPLSIFCDNTWCSNNSRQPFQRKSRW